MIVIGFFAVAFGGVGCLSIFAPTSTAEFLKARGIPIRIGSRVETTSRNVRIVGIAFLGAALICVIVLILAATDPGLQLPFD